MTDLFLYNPRCSKSRAALELVATAGRSVVGKAYDKEIVVAERVRARRFGR